VETDGPKSQEGAPETRTVSNVVPFPRDWLGPRDELVPFGRRAPAEPEAGEETALVHEISNGPSPGPNAFWGEDSAEIHAAMPAPAAGPARNEDRNADFRAAPTQRRRPRRAFALVGAAALAAVAVGIAAVVGLAGRSSPSAQVASFDPAPGNLSAQHLRLASLAKSTARRTVNRPASPQQRKPRLVPKHLQRRRVHKSASMPAHEASPMHSPSPAYEVTTRSVPSSTSSASSASSAPVSSSAPTQPVDVPSSSSGSGVSPSTQPASSSTTPGGSATSSRSEGQSSKAKAPAGPTGSSALLGPGHCNC
jgi:hypothetical protein